jgi:hypothetical protein
LWEDHNVRPEYESVDLTVQWTAHELDAIQNRIPVIVKLKWPFNLHLVLLTVAHWGR